MQQPSWLKLFKIFQEQFLFHWAKPSLCSVQFSENVLIHWIQILVRKSLQEILFYLFSEKMSLLLLLMILIPGLGSNLENLKIVDSLLRQYDRRATPTTNKGIHTTLNIILNWRSTPITKKGIEYNLVCYFFLSHIDKSILMLTTRIELKRRLKWNWKHKYKESCFKLL